MTTGRRVKTGTVVKRNIIRSRGTNQRVVGKIVGEHYIESSNQDNMVLAQKQKHRPMEQGRKPRDKPMHLW